MILRRRAVLALVLGAAAAGPAGAQSLDQYIAPSVFGPGNEPGVTVQSRSRPEFDAPGVRLGNIVVRSNLAEAFGYESNVLGTRRAVGSTLLQTRGGVTAASDWSRNSARAEVTFEDNRFLDQHKQSYTNWTASLGGTLDIGRDQLMVQYQHLDLNQTARDLDVAQLDEALNYRVDTAMATYRVNLNRLYIMPGVVVSNYSYSDGTAGGLPYLQGYRDRVVVVPSIVAGYEFSPRRSAVLVVRDGIASYRRQQAGVPIRDYNDPAVLAGLDYDLTGLVRVRLLAGFEARIFRNSAYKTITSPVLEASLVWTPTGLTTVTGTVARRIQDTADETTAAYTQTSLQFTVDHEYLRNVLLRGTGGVSIGEYDRGSGNQVLYSAGASATYLVNRNARATLSYDFLSRDSSTGGALGISGQTFGPGFNSHRALLQLRLQL